MSTNKAPLEYRWYSRATDYTESIRQRTVDGLIDIQGIRANGLPVGTLLDASCVWKARFLYGNLIAQTTENALLAASRFDELARFLVTQEQAKLDVCQRAFLCFHAHEDKAQVHSLLQTVSSESGFDLRPVLMFATVLEDLDEVIQRLDTLESRFLSVAQQSAIAQVYACVFGDRASAIRILEQAEKHARHERRRDRRSMNWLKVCDAWATLGQRERAAMAVREGEKEARRSLDLEMAGAAWMRVFGESQQALRLLEIAEKRAEDVIDRCFFAETYLELFDDKAEARRCLDSSDALVSRAMDWLYIAESWFHLLRDIEQVAACLARAEPLADYWEDWKILAEYHLDMTGDIASAERCLQRGLETATSEFHGQIFAEALAQLPRKQSAPDPA